MYQLFFTLIISVAGFYAFPQFRWSCEKNHFSVVFPAAYNDTVINANDGIILRAWTLDQRGNYFVAECKKLTYSILDDQYKTQWKKYHDKALRNFLAENQLEKTEEKRFDMGRFHGIQAILNHTTTRLTYFYRHIIIADKSITIYVIQPRPSLDFKIVKRFYQSARYRRPLLK